jgi:hypothetical protein
MGDAGTDKPENQIGVFRMGKPRGRAEERGFPLKICNLAFFAGLPVAYFAWENFSSSRRISLPPLAAARYIIGCVTII